MNDRLIIRGLRVPARIGVTAEERAEPQMLLLSVEVAADLAKAASSDDLTDTIDYDALITEIATIVRTTEVELLERMAELVIGTVSSIRAAYGVSVEIMKEKVPVEEDVASVAIRIERRLR